MLEDKLKKARDDESNLQVELEEKYLESHELKATNNILHEKLQKAEAKLIEYCKSAKKEKDELDEKVEFLANSVMRSTEETLSMERKLTVAKKEIKKIKKENFSLNQRLEAVEEPTKMLTEGSDSLLNNKKVCKVKTSPAKNDDLAKVVENKNTELKNKCGVSEETCCTICAKDIPNYEPEFFQDSEMNPACEECKSENFSISKLPLSSSERKSSTVKSAAEAIAADSSVKVNTFPPEKPFPPTVLHQVKPFPPWQSSAPLSSTFPSVKPFPPF